jgi:hypothetical protein
MPDTFIGAHFILKKEKTNLEKYYPHIRKKRTRLKGIKPFACSSVETRLSKK